MLLVHGGFSRGDVEWADILLRLQGFRAVVPDLRGHGRSDNPAPTLDRRGAGGDLSRLLDELGVESCSVVAFSMGCHLALSLVLERPDLVRRLVLIGPTKELDETLVRRFRRAHPDRSAEAGEPWAVALRSLHPPDRWERLMAALGDGTLNHPDRSDEELGRITCPVLVISGDRDYYGSSTHQSERIAAALPASRFLTLRGPHGVHRRDQGGQPDRVAEEILAFLRGHPGPTPRNLRFRGDPGAPVE